MSAQEQHAQPMLRLIECKSCHDYLTEIEVWRSNAESQKAAIDVLVKRLEAVEDGEDLRHAERELRKLRRTISILNRELADARKQDPAYTDALEIFEYWKRETGHPRSKFTEDREKAVLKALKHYSKRQLAIAILGAKHAAHVSDAGVRYDDIELVTRGAKVETFIARFQAYRLRHGLPPVSEVVDEPGGSGTDESGTTA